VSHLPAIHNLLKCSQNNYSRVCHFVLQDRLGRCKGVRTLGAGIFVFPEHRQILDKFINHARRTERRRIKAHIFATRGLQISKPVKTSRRPPSTITLPSYTCRVKLLLEQAMHAQRQRAVRRQGSHTFYTISSQMGMRSALRAGHTLPPGCVGPRATVWLERFG
jgi:hypothetical protein